MPGISPRLYVDHFPGKSLVHMGDFDPPRSRKKNWIPASRFNPEAAFLRQIVFI
jgi:hypothetical protein